MKSPWEVSQWESVLQNLGEWRGSFTMLSPTGELQEDIPSLISLQGVDENRSIHLELNRYYPVAGAPEREHRQLVLDFSAPGAGAVFFETGAFSEGSLFLSPTRFGAENCLVDGDRRLRLVQMFEQNQFLRLTLIREQRVGTDAPEQAPLELADLLGEWQGEAVTLSPGRSSAERRSVSWTMTRQSETHIVLDAGVTASVNRPGLQFERQGQIYQTLLLPDGGFSISPVAIAPGKAFSLESGWLRSPTVLQRLIRDYNDKGEWNGSTWMTLCKRVQDKRV
jgi:Domain of unknown function (DUF3598)